MFPYFLLSKKSTEKISMCFLKINMFSVCFFENTKHFSKSLQNFFFFSCGKHFSNVDPTENTSLTFYHIKNFFKSKHTKKIKIQNG
jgi:hypothetical protein